jgi:hypothetical protein
VSSSDKFTFFLGGRDLEMLTIRALLEREVSKAEINDKNLAWGAKLSDYAREIEAAVLAGRTAVGVELADDMPEDWAVRGSLLLVDHHGDRSEEPPSLKQVFDLLRLPEARWTRDFALVAANDAGHVRGMKAIGAATDKMMDIRARDRAAQGVTADEERLGLEAINRAEIAARGRLLLVTLSHGRSATVTDPLALDPACAHLPKNVIVRSPASVMFFGVRSVVDILRVKFPNGFSGGSGSDGFFGISPCENADANRVEHEAAAALV